MASAKSTSAFPSVPRQSRALDWSGEHYYFKNFSLLVGPVNKSIPIPVGGSSDAAYAVGGKLADIFGLWGEPLKETKE
jgi:alkanesulfonate monooxygenase